MTTRDRITATPDTPAIDPLERMANEETGPPVDAVQGRWNVRRTTAPVGSLSAIVTDPP